MGGGLNRGMRTGARRLVFFVIRLTGLPFVIRRLIQKRRVSIVCYHDPDPQTFDRHIRCLKDRYTIIPLERYVHWRANAGGSRLPPSPLVVTLDDGRRGNAKLLPVLRRHRVPATLFVCSGIVATHRHFWWTKTGDAASRERLKRLDDDARLRWLAGRGFTETSEYKDRQALSMEELDALGEIADLQSHTRFHPILPRCTTRRVREEMESSKRQLEQALGRPVYALAYPNGAYTDREVHVARQAGYACAVTTEGGYNDSTTDLFRLRRIGIPDHASVSEVIVRASGLWDLVIRSLWRRETSASRMTESEKAEGGTGVSVH